MAIMSETPVVTETASVEHKVGTVLPAEALPLDAQVNGTKGHVEPPPTPSIGVVKTNGDANGDIHMEEADALLNGEATEPSAEEHSIAPADPRPSEPIPSIETAADALPVNPIEETSAVPPAIEQPISDARDESLPVNMTSEAEPEAMSVDEPESEVATTQTDAEPASQPQQDSNTPVPKQESPLNMSPTQTAGQVRPREEEEDDDNNPAKRTKLTPEGEALHISTPPAPASASTEAAAMAPPALPGATPATWDSRPMTEHQRKFLLESIRKAKKTKAAIPFQSPVDPVALNLPTYLDVIKVPMDISTLEEKLKESKYANANDFWADFELIYKNSVAFNGTQHPVTVQGQNLQAYFAKMMSLLPKADANYDANKKKALPTPKPSLPRRESRSAASAKANPPANVTPTIGATSTASKPAPTKAKQETKKSEAQIDSNGVPVIRRDSESNRPKREIIKPPPRDLPYTTAKPKKKQNQLELKFCENLIKEMKKAKYQTFVYPFMIPVDPIALNIPSYHTIVKKPMDFGTIDKKLSEGAYASAKDFYNDSKLVFQNCYSFNPHTDPVHQMGKQSEALFDEQWKKKDEWIQSNQPPSEPASEEESGDESEESDTEIAGGHFEKIAELQKQITALSDQIIQLTAAASVKTKSKKKKEKKHKGEGGNKKRPLTETQVPAKKASKQAKIPKPKKLTLDQKRYVSEGIGMLDEVNMRKAVQMIRNGVPKLKDVHDDELELDVDEIPDNVLHELLRFVKQFRNQNGADEDDDYEEAEPIKQHSTTQRKKSKPMSAREQESKIAQVRQQLQRFDNSGSDQANDAAQGDSSDDESSSSEEE